MRLYMTGGETLLSSSTIKPTLQHLEQDADAFDDADDVSDFNPDTFTRQRSARVPEADTIASTGKPVNQQLTADLLMKNAEVLLPQGEKDMNGKVVKAVSLYG